MKFLFAGLVLSVVVRATAQDLRAVASLKDSVQTYFVQNDLPQTRKWIRSFDDSLAGKMRKYLKQLAVKQFDDAFLLRQQLDFVKDGECWTESQVGLKLKYQNHTAVISLFQAFRFGLQGQQLDWDHYWKINDKFYVNINPGVGFNQLYPQWKLGGNVFYTGIKKTELGLGYRHTKFPGNPVNMLITSFTFYPKGMYANLQYFNINSNAGIGHTLLVRLRKYLHSSNGYFIVNGTVGTQVDRTGLQGNLFTTNRVGAGMNYRISPRLSAEGIVAFENQVITEQKKREIASINFQLNYHFKMAK